MKCPYCGNEAIRVGTGNNTMEVLCVVDDDDTKTGDQGDNHDHQT